MSLQDEAGAESPEVRSTDPIQGAGTMGHKCDAPLCLFYNKKRAGDRPAKNLGEASGFSNAR